MPRLVRTLLVDNHDSFTYNIFQMVAAVNGIPPIVVRNDERTWAELRELAFDNVIISPGPGRPDEAHSFGVSADVIANAEVPVLGICLGHQGIARHFGAKVVPAPTIMHGRCDAITHDGSALFAGIASPFQAVRYHSLCVVELPDELEVLARGTDDVVMALRHRHRPLYGVQFHPESILSEDGRRLFENFAALTPTLGEAERTAFEMKLQVPAPTAPWQLGWRRVETMVSSEQAFSTLFASTPHAFWLDSSARGDARFSFMGNGEGPESHVLRYRVGGAVQIVSQSQVVTVDGDVMSYLAEQLTRRRASSDDLPFDFQCGYVGYLGYEMKAECGARAAHVSHHYDAQWLFADRLLAFDHEARCVYLVEASRSGEATPWLAEMEARLRSLEPGAEPAMPDAAAQPWQPEADGYRRRFARCQQALRDGETYEICLTTQLHLPDRPEGLALHRCLRRQNPAPYAAYLAFEDLQLVCSSPERFLKIDRCRNAETKPIKGTGPRGATPAEDEAFALSLARSEKDRAENLMIVDVLRNDLGRVCDVGSVHVPKLMDIERYATVHQMVTTVRGRLRDDVTTIDAVRALFPGGSMTGAPKLRTMEILDELETEARGPYAGTIGYLSLNGAADLNIVIRTIVVDERGCSIGVGGAITVMSDVDEEMAEMVLKGAAPRRAIATATSGTR